ncbi:MAG TPA: 7TM diverse intracellular signaling domain-containing protein [Chitinophagaceae bacterium]
MSSKLRAFAFRLFQAVVFPAVAWSQPAADTMQIDIAPIPAYRVIRDRTEVAFASPHASLYSQYAKLDFSQGATFRKDIAPQAIPLTLVLRFRVINSADRPDSVWFFPGFYYWSIHLYRANGSYLTALPSIEPAIPDSIGYRMLALPAHDSGTFVAELRMAKTYTNNIRPRLIRQTHLPTFIYDLLAARQSMNIITYIFCGLLLMMILFSAANFVLGGNREFLFYTGYALFLGAMLFSKTYYDHAISPGAFLLESYLDFVLQCVGIAFYMLFMQKFLEAREKHPFLYRLYNIGIAALAVAIAGFSYVYFFTETFVLLNGIENITKLTLLAMMLIFVVYCTRQWQHRLLRYLFWGNLFYFIFAVASQLLILAGQIVKNLPAIFNNSLFYYETGLLLELLFFLSGLSYKNRRQIIEQTKERERLTLENERKEFEKQLAIVNAQQDERNRISSDMHDELGSGMTHIRLMSEIAKNKMKDSTPVEIEKISQSANDVLNKMNAIIWSMNSHNDSLGNLISYIRAYALDYLEGTDVKCAVSIPYEIPDRELTGDKRRNIFLCVKETLTNIIKHSHASGVTIDFIANHTLQITIADDGVGIDLNNIRKFGNGLQNIEQRMRNIGGSYVIRRDNGTVTIFSIPL